MRSGSSRIIGVAGWVTMGILVLTANAARGQADLKVALGGHCPVSYQKDSKAVKGDPAFAVPFQGWVYHCASAEAKKEFEGNPEKYIAQYGEQCTTALGGMYGNSIPADPTVFYVIDGKLYLFSSLRARNSFDRAPQEYIGKAHRLYARPSLSGYSVPGYQLENKAVKGDPRFKRVHRGLVYHFASEEHARAFEKEPDRLVPQYDGLCAEGMSQGKRFPADPKVFAVIDGKTYLFFDEKAKNVFMADAKAMIEKANTNWSQGAGAAKKSAPVGNSP